LALRWVTCFAFTTEARRARRETKKFRVDRRTDRETQKELFPGPLPQSLTQEEGSLGAEPQNIAMLSKTFSTKALLTMGEEPEERSTEGMKKFRAVLMEQIAGVLLRFLI